ncbi:MAG: hypothetical protein DMD91_09385 [Candidatus Rokuibacteriota bacterium]|nr:MAG: hypothetical protein DMD91_09385 [Candidatus Rokubacteria bacterium]
MRARIAALAGLALLAAACSPTPFQRGLYNYERGRYPRAVEAFDEAIRTNPTADAYANRGAAKARLKDMPGAIADFTRALALRPDDVEVLVNRGNAYVITRDFKAAVVDFTRVIELDKSLVLVWFNRGLARSRLGDMTGAQEDWKQAIALAKDPAAQAALERRAEALARETGVSPPAAPDVRALARRAIDRELAGDHAGALIDLRSALALEGDPERRAALEDLLRRWEEGQ